MSQVDPVYLASLPPTYLAEDASAPLLRVSIALIVLQTFIVAAFYISRYLNNTTNGIEFWWLVPASFVFCTANIVGGISLIKYGGAGRHMAALMIEDPQKIINWLKIDAGMEYVYVASVSLPKLTILALYMRIFPAKPYRIVAYAIGALVIVTWIASYLSSSLTCRPFAYRWDKTIPGGMCGNLMAGYRSISVPGVFADFLILVLPLPAIYKLHVELPVKIGLFLTFTLASFGIVTCIIRTVEFFTRDLFTDPTFNCIMTMIWTAIEPSVYMMAACMPSIRPLKRILMPQFSISAMLSSYWTKTTEKASWRYSKKDGAQIWRTRQVILVSNEVDNVERNSTKSTAGLHVPQQGYVELEEWQVSHAPSEVAETKAMEEV